MIARCLLIVASVSIAGCQKAEFVHMSLETYP